MKNFFTVIALILISQTLFSQLEFEKGYIIDKNGSKTEGYIKNGNWRVLPEHIFFKTNELSKKQTVKVNMLKEFSINKKRKFIKFNVDIDRSNDKRYSNNIHYDYKDYNKNPVFKKENLFLEILIEGEYNLYKYSDNSLVRFFYSKANQNPKQLIYKQYYKKVTKREGAYEYNMYEKMENLFFRKQLYDLASDCSDLQDNALSVYYNEKELIEFFTNLNKCTNAHYQTYMIEKTYFELWVGAGFGKNHSKYYNNSREVNDFDFNKGNVNSYVVRISYNPAFGRGNWLLFFQGKMLFRSEVKSTENSYLTGALNRYAIVNYRAANISIGFHYNLPIMSRQSLYGEVMFNFEQPLNFSKMQTLQKDNNSLLNTKYFHNTLNFISYGVGYMYKDKIRLGLYIVPNHQEFTLANIEFLSSSVQLMLMYNFL
jgi:hypothetical protein